MPTRLNLTGERFGRWLVLEKRPSHTARTFWLCRCDCGNERIVSTVTLRTARSQSCGCRRVEVSALLRLTHGRTRTTEYRAWAGAKKRCYNPRAGGYQNYGGRGIVMCEKWKNDAVAFLTDMGPCPAGYSLHRINNDGPYSPENCRWASDTEQARNTTRNHFIECDGQLLTLAEWGEKVGLQARVIYKRIKRGWDVQRALSEPMHH